MRSGARDKTPYECLYIEQSGIFPGIGWRDDVHTARKMPGIFHRYVIYSRFNRIICTIYVRIDTTFADCWHRDGVLPIIHIYIALWSAMPLISVDCLGTTCGVVDLSSWAARNSEFDITFRCGKTKLDSRMARFWDLHDCVCGPKKGSCAKSVCFCTHRKLIKKCKFKQNKIYNFTYLKLILLRVQSRSNFVLVTQLRCFFYLILYKFILPDIRIPPQQLLRLALFKSCDKWLGSSDIQVC